MYVHKVKNQQKEGKILKIKTTQSNHRITVKFHLIAKNGIRNSR